MKRRWICAIAVITAVILLPFWPADASEAYIGNVNAEIDKSGIVTISGNCSRGPGYAITVKITAPDGSVVYVNEAASGIDGNFTFTTLLSGNKKGRYQVMIGTNDILEAVRTYFDYFPDKTDSIKAIASVNASVDKSNKVTVSGTISTGDGQQLSVMIRDPAGRIELIDYCISSNGGKYEYSYFMKNTRTGRYQVTVGAPGLGLPVSAYFDYSTNVTVKAEISDNRQVAISGNIGSGAGQQVTIRITDPSGMIEYVGSTISRDGGDFSLEYTMRNDTTGKYLVTIGANGLPTMAETYFIFTRPAPPSEEPSDELPPPSEPVLSSNADLSDLILNGAVFIEPFSSSNTEYLAVINPGSTAVTVTPTASHNGARITVNGAPVASGSPSAPIEFVDDMVQVDIIVTAEDGTMKTYIVTVILN